MTPFTKLGCWWAFICFIIYIIYFISFPLFSRIFGNIHFGFIFGPLSWALGFVFFTQRRRAMDKARVSRFWPSAEGEVIVSEITHLDAGSSYNVLFRTIHYEYRPNIVYRYRVGEAEYRGNSTEFERAQLTREHSEKLIKERYPVGTRVPVHYNPSAPWESTLQIANIRVAQRGMPVVLFCVVFGLAWVCIGLADTLPSGPELSRWYGKEFLITVMLISAALGIWCMKEHFD